MIADPQHETLSRLWTRSQGFTVREGGQLKKRVWSHNRARTPRSAGDAQGRSNTILRAYLEEAIRFNDLQAPLRR